MTATVTAPFASITSYISLALESRLTLHATVPFTLPHTPSLHLHPHPLTETTQNANGTFLFPLPANSRLNMVAEGSGGGGGGGGVPGTTVPSSVKREEPVVETGTTVNGKVGLDLDGDGGGEGGAVGRGPSSSFSGLPVVSKEEEEEEEEAEEDAEMVTDRVAACGNGNNGSSSCSSTSPPPPPEGVPKPMEGLNEAGLPPFLKKTFEMVEDPETDSVVSWSESRDSFVVWDQHEFSKDLLPKYFKHQNFSSFIRQLNTYGFRKIDPDRWEFANQGFRGGKKHLLKNIKRRGRITKKQQGPTIPEDIQTMEMDFQRTEVESEIRTLKEDQEILKLDILELRQQQECSLSEIGSVEEQIRCAECRQQQMFLFLAKAVKNPHFVEQLVQKRKPSREIQAGKFIKKRRLLTSELDPNRCDFEGTNDDKSSACVDGQKGILSERVDPKPDGFANPLSNENFTDALELKFNNVMLHEDASTIYDAMSEKLLNDSSLIAEGEIGEELAINDSNIYMELEYLIGEPCDWGRVNELKEQPVALMPSPAV
ncbi:hypothetical protein ACJRO7_013925 [Eucalyptus globulus]|uniref:HSF-type DNA-binding domain-containing protein n=1 Tax=Eucalyptus globulus TaxID=34317 RepID=A0ABD3L954_EUCGL